MIRIFEYSNIRHTLTEHDFDTNEYPNIFVSRKWYERISEYIRIKKIDTNECPNKYSYRKYSNIQIFKYIRHTLIWTSILGTFIISTLMHLRNKDGMLSKEEVLSSQNLFVASQATDYGKKIKNARDELWFGNKVSNISIQTH